MNAFRENKRQACELCGQKRSGPRYGILPAKTVCEECWENRRDEAVAVLDPQPTPPTDPALEIAAQVKTLTVDQVLEYARGQGQDFAGVILEAERAGLNRVSLVRELEKLL